MERISHISLSLLRLLVLGAEDVGTTVSDIQEIFHKTRFVTCIPSHLGGSGNPSHPTAIGVVSAMEAALDFHKMGTLQGKKVAMQGSGKENIYPICCSYYNSP